MTDPIDELTPTEQEREQVAAILNRRADRDGPGAGADAVLAAARQETFENGSRRTAFTLAAAALLLAGFALLAVLALRDGSGIVLTDEPGGESLSEDCIRTATPVGQLQDDPADLCSQPLMSDGDEQNEVGLVVLGNVAAGVAINDDGTFVLEYQPRAGRDSEPILPADSAAGVAMLPIDSSGSVAEGGLVVETGFVVGHADYQAERVPGAFYELVVTAASSPTYLRPEPFLATDAFGGETALSCRVELDGTVICGLTDSDDVTVWTSTFFESASSEPVFGGTEEGPRSFSRCDAQDSAADCVDDVVLTVTETAIRIDVNGVKYFEQTGLEPLPAELQGEVTVWWAVASSRSEVALARFHGG